MFGFDSGVWDDDVVFGAQRGRRWIPRISWSLFRERGGGFERFDGCWGRSQLQERVFRGAIKNDLTHWQ